MHSVLDVLEQRQREYEDWLGNPTLPPPVWLKTRRGITYGQVVKPPSEEELQRRIVEVNLARRIS